MGVPPYRHRLLPPPVEETAARFDGQHYSETPLACPNCRWSQSVTERLWRCRRWPPVVNVNRPGESMFPMVGPLDYCGEFSQ